MTRSEVVAAGASAAVGVVAALLTGFIDVTPAGLLGARWYGFPLTWLRRLIIAPQYNPWRLDLLGLIADLALWTLVAVAVGFFGAWLYDRRGLGREETRAPG